MHSFSLPIIDLLTITDQEQNRKQKMGLLTNLGWKLCLVFRKGQY